MKEDARTDYERKVQLQLRSWSEVSQFLEGGVPPPPPPPLPRSRSPARRCVAVDSIRRSLHHKVRRVPDTSPLSDEEVDSTSCFHNGRLERLAIMSEVEEWMAHVSRTWGPSSDVVEFDDEDHEKATSSIQQRRLETRGLATSR